MWNAEHPPEHTAEETNRWRLERRKGRRRDVLGSSQTEQMSQGKESDGELGTNHHGLHVLHQTAQRALGRGDIIFLTLQNPTFSIPQMLGVMERRL